MEEINKFLKKTYFEKNRVLINKVIFTVAAFLWIGSAFFKIIEVERYSNLFADYTYFFLVLGTLLLLFDK